MDPWALTSAAAQEPWRLWTGHLDHFGWAHALANGLALLVPLVLLPGPERRRAAVAMLVAAPILSLLLLPGLEGGTYRGASGLACALWALAGVRLAGRGPSAAVGTLMLAGLGLKLAAEAVLGTGFLVRAEGWQTLPPAHLWGAVLGLAAALPWRRPPAPA